MSPSFIFNLHLVLGYVAWLLCTAAYIRPKLEAMNRIQAQRAIAMLHSFRFFGLVFILPGVTGHNLPSGFAPFAAYGDFATGVLAMLAVFAVRFAPVFWPLIVGFNIVGAIDILVDYYHGIRLSLPAASGELGSTYAIVVVYVPLLMITHVISLNMLLRRHKSAKASVSNAIASKMPG
jgi:hypothetical protein